MIGRALVFGILWGIPVGLWWFWIMWPLYPAEWSVLWRYQVASLIGKPNDPLSTTTFVIPVDGVIIEVTAQDLYASHAAATITRRALASLTSSAKQSAVVILGTAGLYFVICLVRGMVQVQHKSYRGTRLDSVWKLRVKQVGTLWKWSEVNIQGIRLPHGSDCTHIATAGATRSGKSTLLMNLLEQARQRHEPALVYDPDGGYIASFLQERDIVLNPLDQRFPGWSPWQEVNAPYHYDDVGQALSAPAQAVSGEATWWHTMGGLLIAEALRALGHRHERTNEALVRAIATMTQSELETLLAGTSAAVLTAKEGERMMQSVRGTAIERVRCLSYVPDGNFSIRRWVQNPGSSCCFLSASSDQREMLRPLITAWLAVAISAFLLRPESSPRLWLFVDEFASLYQIPRFFQLLAEGAKHRVCVVIGMQTVAQVERLYGSAGARDLLSHPQTSVIFRAADWETARWSAERLGGYHVREIRESEQYGVSTARDGLTLSEHDHRNTVVLPEELQRLPNHEYFISLPGQHPVVKGLTRRRRNRPIAPAFLPRTGESGQTQQDGLAALAKELLG
jgi:hypothetical protein